MRPVPSGFWTAVAERSDDTAFERKAGAGCEDARRAGESGVALRFPPQSKMSRMAARSRSFNPNGIVSSSPGLPSPRGYPGYSAGMGFNPNGVASRADRNPVGVGHRCHIFTQGSSCLATLGCQPESRWDSLASIRLSIRHQIPC